MTTDSSEQTQRCALVWRIGYVRWLCVLGGLVFIRAPLGWTAAITVALYNIAPFWFTPRFTEQQLRLFGWIILALDGIALALTTALVVQPRDYPVPLLLLFFEASLYSGFESLSFQRTNNCGDTRRRAVIGQIPGARFSYPSEAKNQANTR